MKIFSTILFILLPFTPNASGKEDFRAYELSGEYKAEHLYGDMWERHYFYIYDNMIYGYAEGEMYVIYKFPDGEYIFTTKNNSKIKVSVTDGILDYLIVYDEESFRRNEKKVDENNYYCIKGIHYGLNYYLYDKKQYKNMANKIKIKNIRGEVEDLSDIDFYVYKEKDDYIILFNYGEETILGPSYGQVNFWFDEQKKNWSMMTEI
jgi:hypothetical protein